MSEKQLVIDIKSHIETIIIQLEKELNSQTWLKYLEDKKPIVSEQNKVKRFYDLGKILSPTNNSELTKNINIDYITTIIKTTISQLEQIQKEINDLINNYNKKIPTKKIQSNQLDPYSSILTEYEPARTGKDVGDGMHDNLTDDS